MRYVILLITMAACGGATDETSPPPCDTVGPASEEVSVTNAYGPLAGTLEVPFSCGAVPVVLILSGSGSQDRDGNAYGNSTNMYLDVSEALRAAGIASLRYDDPGIAGSFNAAPLAVEDFRYTQEVSDATLWIAALRSDERFSSVIVAGHSQGSLTAMLVAKSAPIDGFVSLAGSGKPAGRLLIEQVQDDLTTEQLADLEAAVTALEHGEPAGPLAPPLNQVLPEDVQPYFISWFPFDPVAEIAQLEAPALLVHGTTDWTVPPAHAELLHAGKPDAELLLVPNMTHTLKGAHDDEAEQRAAYTDPTVPLAAGLMQPIIAFVRRVSGHAGD